MNDAAAQFGGKRVLVMGLGIHGGGLGVARFLAQHGADVTVTDMRPASALQSSIDALAGLPVRYVLGEHRESDFASAEIVVRNPGVPRESRFLQVARAAGAQIEMEMTIFFRLCAGPILGITGTKGKTTTTMLTGAMLREQFPQTVVAGNLRVSALEQLPNIDAATPVVLELSSFVLEGLDEAGLSPQYACVTNLAPDHLDRYASFDDYAEAKHAILRHQRASDTVVLNADDPRHREWGATAPGRVIWFGAAPTTDETVVAYGPDGVWWPGDGLLVPAEDITLPGMHNRANIAAAAALARAFGTDAAAIRQAVRSFGGVEHRLEFVRELDGVRYINDTAATAPEAAIAALRSTDAPLVVIAGGADKLLPLDALATALAARAKTIVLLDGTATPRLQEALQAAGRTDMHGPHRDFAAAIAVARAAAAPGDTVLLSPGCASFGMFRNEFHRGEEFRRIVSALEPHTAA